MKTTPSLFGLSATKPSNFCLGVCDEATVSAALVNKNGATCLVDPGSENPVSDLPTQSRFYPLLSK